MRVWVDVDNAPHALIFRPIIERLRERDAEVEVTARARTYVAELLSAAGIPFTVVGRGQPSGSAAKVAALGSRVLGLARFGARRRFDVAVGHGSRALPPAATFLRVPNLTMLDYEHVSTSIFRRWSQRILVPRVVADRANGSLPRGPWRTYEGMKEEIYLADFRPQPGIREGLGVERSTVLLVLRPPSRTAHYHDARSEVILGAVVQRVARSPGVRAVWLRRDAGDRVPPEVERAGFTIPGAPLDGPSLIAAADLVISGGGTMIREAALLGTPAYSIFTGPMGAVDAELERSARLTAVRRIEDVATIPLVPKPPARGVPIRAGLAEFVVDEILDLARSRR